MALVLGRLTNGDSVIITESYAVNGVKGHVCGINGSPTWVPSSEVKIIMISEVHGQEIKYATEKE